MLKYLRGKKSSWIIKIILILIILSFAIWGISGIFQGWDKSNMAATVGSMDISKGYLVQKTRDRLRQIMMSTKKEITFEEALKLDYPRQILEETIQKILLDYEVLHLKLTLTDHLLMELIKHDPSFRKNGSFDKNLLDRYLKGSGLSEQYFAATVKDQLIKNQLILAVIAKSPIPSTLTLPIYKTISEERTLNFLSIPKEGMSVRPPKEEELKKYFEENKEEFREPERREIQVLILDPKNLEKNHQITEEDLKNEYNQRVSEFLIPETRHVFVKSFKTKGEADFFMKRLSSSKNPTLTDMVDLRNIEKKDLIKEDATKIFSAKEKGIVGPMGENDQWKVYFVKDIQKESYKPFKSVRDTLAKDLKQKKVMDEAAQITQNLDQSVSEGLSFEELSKSYPLSLVKVPAVSRSGKKEDSTAFSHPLISVDMINFSFTQDERFESSIMESENGLYYLVFVDKVHTSHIPPFDAAKDKVTKAVLNKARIEKAKETATSLLPKLAKNDLSPNERALWKIAQVKGTRMSILKETEQKYPASLIGDLFTSPKNVSVIKHDRSGNYYVGVTRKIGALDMEGKMKDYLIFKDQSAGMISEELMEQFISGLKKRFNVTVNEHVLSSLES